MQVDTILKQRVLQILNSSSINKSLIYILYDWENCKQVREIKNSDKCNFRITRE